MSKTVKQFTIVNRILNSSQFDDNVISIILHYYWNLLPKRKVLLDWIDPNKLIFEGLSYNKNAIGLLYDNIDKIDWFHLSSNKNAIKILEQHQDKIDWEELAQNPSAIHLIENNIDEIDWDLLSANKNAIKLFKKKLG